MKLWKKLLALLLALTLSSQLALPAMAAVVQNGDVISLTDKEGNVLKSGTQEDWEKEFPYGTFAFEKSEVACAEGDAEGQVIRVLRLGGTAGKAEVTISVNPVISQLDDGRYSAAMAASFYDYTLAVEDALPIAAYQPYGRDPQPLEPEEPVTVSRVESALPEDETDAAGEDGAANCALKLDAQADAYRWQGKNADGLWLDVADTETLELTEEALEESDFRCVYTVGGVTYCSESYHGEAYVYEEEILPEIPADLPRNPEKSFHVLDPEASGIEALGSYEFDVVFAEGETEKEILLTPVDDEDAENTELLALRVSACKGGTLYDTANTLTVAINDNEAQLPSYFGFEVMDLTVDKAAGSAILTVRRTGALQYAASVDYSTLDGTAAAGKDYSETTGTLYFPPDMDELTVEIPLINDGELLSEEESELYFTVRLENPTGGGENSAILPGKDAALVNLYNSGESDERNLATMLYTPEADDVSGSTAISEDSIAGGTGEMVQARAEERTYASVDVVQGSSRGGRRGGISLMSFDLTKTKLKLDRGTLPTSKYWDDYADFGGTSRYANTNNTQGLAYQGWDDYNQVKRQSDGYMGRYDGEVGGSNGAYLKWNTQKFANFDQLFSTVNATYRGKTENNYMNQFHSTSRAGLVRGDSGLNVSSESVIKRGKPSGYSDIGKSFAVRKGDTGLFIALGIEDKGGVDTRHAGGSIYQIARGQRKYLENGLRYQIHTVDDTLIQTAGQTALYDYIAPSVSVEAGKGGVKAGKGVYVGTELTFSAPVWNGVYQYADINGGINNALYLSDATHGIVNYGSVGKTGEASTLSILGGNGNSFASNGGNLGLNGNYTVNVVLDRVQKISINVTPSVARNVAEDERQNAIDDAWDTFWNRANIQVRSGEAKVSGSNVTFEEKTSAIDASWTQTENAAIQVSGAQKNIVSINFGLPHADQILFNGVQYAGDENITIPLSMLGMETLPFVYYASEYVNAESDMTLTISRIEHYIDSNGNGQLDGTLDGNNVFQLTDAENGKDTLLRTLSAGDYSITEFTPVYGNDGKPVRQFLKFYYSMTPRCLTVPEGASADDPAQILPAFVTSVTDAGALSQLSREMQGYRFVDSGKKMDGSYSGDNKLMYGAAANTTETVDVPLGGDFAQRKATYVYQSENDTPVTKEYPDGTTAKVLPTHKSDLNPTQIAEKQKSGTEEEKAQYKGWYLVDVTFEQENWQVDYQGSMLYRFQSPDEVYISDPNFGQRLPVQGTRKGEDGTLLSSDAQKVDDINAYLGSLNERDTINLCIRPQGSQSTDKIHAFYGGGTSARSAIALYTDIETSEHHVKVDSANPSGIRTVPDASALSNTSGADGSPTQEADSGESSNPMGEFNLDMGIELPSLSLSVTDYVTLITDGDQFGFSIGVPLFSASKKKTSVASDKDRYVAPNQKPANSWSDWSTENPIKKNAGNAEQVKGVFTNFQETIKGDAWQSLKGAQERALKRNVWGDPLTDANGKTSYNDKLVKSANMEFSLSFNVTVMFKYSPVENAYRFSSAMILLQFGFQFRQEIRLSVCPILYAYLMVGVNLEAGGGLKSDREIVEDTSAVIDINSPDDVNQTDPTKPKVTLNGEWSYVAREGAKGKYVMNGLPAKVSEEEGVSDRPAASMTFTSPSNAFHAYFSGKLQVERKTGENDWESLGYISSDGSSPVLVMSGKKLDAESSTTFRLTVLEENAFLDRVAPIREVRSDLYFSGISLSPSAFMEVGAGIGVELLKAEIYFKASIAISMSFATRADDSGSSDTAETAQFTTYQGAEARIVEDNGIATYGNKTTAFSFDSFNFRAGFGVRVVLLFFKFEMDLIQFGIDYDKEQVGKGENGFHSNGWKFAWYALNGQTIKSYSMENAGTDTIALDENFPGVKITIPANDFTAQKIFGPEEGRMVMDEIATYAFDPGNLPTNEFQISGYSSSGDAFRLAEGLDSGSAYQLLTVGETNYLLYTVTREQTDTETGETTPATGIHASQLVLSKVKNTGETVGLVNPVNEDSKTPYIPVDNDNTGDLDFTAQVQDDTIRVMWVSYADNAGSDVKPSVPKPTSLRPSYYNTENDTTVYMSKLNYEDVRFKPSAPDGDRPTAPTAPVQADYWLSVKDYEALSEEEQKKYTPAYDSTTGSETGGETSSETGTVIGYYIVTDKIKSLTAAQEAFEAAQKTYAVKKAAYDAAMVDWNDYDVKSASYTAWMNYFNADATAQDLLSDSAAKTVVKTAEFTVDDGNQTAFTAATVIGNAGTYKFLPAMSADGNFLFYARSKPYDTTAGTDGKSEKELADDKALEYYDATKGDATTDADGVSTGEGDPTAAFRYAYATSMNDVYGKTTQFVFRYNGTDYVFEPTGWADSNTRLSSVDLVMLDDSTFYLAYTATQTQTSVKTDEATKTTEAGETNVHKLYLQKGSIAGGEVTLQPAKLLRTLVDINEGGSAITLGGNEAKQDGVYVNGTLKEAHEDPYFGKVRFLHGKLGGLTGESEDFTENLPFTTYSTEDAETETSETFLLFEMNGAAYVVPQTSLDSITSGSSGSIIPFFTVTDETRGRGNLDIGADGEGNISVVYTAAVPNTTNNAIYVAKYDAETGSFGQGRMLAMNQMQVYEDSIANGWSSEDTEKAYLGQLESYDYAPDRLTSFTFSDLAVAVGLKKGTIAGINETTGEPVTADNSTLVILARGTQTTLEEQPFLGNTSEETTVIAPAYDENGLMMTNTGMYALSFGVGEKSVGEGRILFESDDFVPGAQLRPTVTFKNTGDVPLRGSEKDPITVELCLSGTDGIAAGTKLMTWTIQKSIRVGQTVTTTLGAEDFASPLPDELDGRCFYFTVSETGRDGDHPFGVDEPLNYDSHALKKDEEGNTIGYVGYVRAIESKPELAVEDLEFSTLGVEGDFVRIGVSMNVTNRGTAVASAPYLLFEYQNGYETLKDGYQQEIYAPLDISRGEFDISNQSPIVTLAAYDDVPAKGVLKLEGEDGADLKANHQRKVTGVFLVPKTLYCAESATGSLNLKVSVRQDSGTSVSTQGFVGRRPVVVGDGDFVVTPGMGVGGGIVIDPGTGTPATPVVTPTTPAESEVSVYSGEYVADNNQRFASLEQTTFITAPKKLTLPLGGTMRLAMPVTTTKAGSIPQIEVKEINSQDNTAAEPNMGVLYYNMGASGTGSDGFLVLSPASEGNGIIRVTDPATSTVTDIAYAVTPAGSGVNIYKDNDLFTWYDASGTKIADPEKTTEGESDWFFKENITAWGDGSEQGNPYRGDLSWGKKGAYFTFDTLAEKFTLTLYGKVQITATDSDGQVLTDETHTANGGADSAAAVTVDLGKNASNETRHVTVKVLSDQAAFDRLLEQYAGNQPLLPDTDSGAPEIYFGRTLPEIASLKGGSITIPVYVVDANGVSAVVVTNDEIAKNDSQTRPDSEQLYPFDLKVTGNGVFTIKAVNGLGKASEIHINVDWFNQSASNPDDPLTMSRKWVYEGSDRIIGDTDQLQKGETAFLTVTTNLDDSAPLTVTKTLFYYAVSTVTTTTAYELKEIPVEGSEETQWVIVKTVTRTDEDGTLLEEKDEKGNLIPNPQITRESAQNGENTEPPEGSRVLQTRGEWQKVGPDSKGRFPVTSNGIYRLIAELKDGRSATEVFRMDRLNDALPTVILTQAEAEEGSLIPELRFTANKGKNSASGLDAVKLGTYPLKSAATDGITRLSGSFLAPYNGEYVVTVTDKAGNRNDSSAVEIKGLALAAPADAITTAAATDNGKSNGSVTVRANALLGGSLDSIDEKGLHNQYQAALVPAADAFDERGGKSFADFAAEKLTNNWKSVESNSDTSKAEFPGLTPGVYVLYLRDATDTDSKVASKTLAKDDCLILRLTVNDGSVNFSTQRSGQDLTIRATGAESYEYLLFPAKDGKLVDYTDLDTIIQASQDAENKRAQEAWEAAKAQAEKDLPVARDALTEAQKTLDDLRQADPKDEAAIKAAEAAVAEAQFKVADLERIKNSTVDDYKNPLNVTTWQTDNTYLDLSYGTYQITVRDSGDTSRYLSHLVTLAPPSSQGELTEKQEKDIIQRNQTEDVAVEGKDSTVILPKGLLKDGDSVNALLLTAPKTGFTPGTVVTVTVNGETRILPWCTVTEDGRLLYLATERGSYALAENAKAFADTVDYWAEDDIAFTSARELFRGTTDTTFSPDRAMTRAMFVTVLGRMAGVDENGRSASRFTDVPADFWCAAYVNWAAENGIIDGYADGSFRPNEPVQRQQMAKILRNFAKYLGENVDAKGSLARYTDRSIVSAWAVDPCVWATDRGLLQGRQDGRLDPRGQATRAQVSAVLHRYVDHILTRRLVDAETLP